MGKSIRTPGSVVSEPYDAAQYLLINPQAESTEFYQQMKKRETARKAFVEIDNDQAMRRAVLRRIRPHRGHLAPGTHVMYWRQTQWRGPGRVIHQEDQHVVWISHLGKIFRVAPEHVRLLSEREIQSSWKTVQETSPLEMPQRSGHGVFQYEDLISPDSASPPIDGVMIQPEIPTVPTNEAPILIEPILENQSGITHSEQPDAEPDHSQTDGTSQEHPGTPTGTDVPIPDDASEEALYCEDYWIVKKRYDHSSS